MQLHKSGLMIFLSLMLLVIPILSACDDDDGTKEPTATPTATATPIEPAEDVKITIGNISDMTGPASGALLTVNMALDDMIRYANEENLIPGVELDVLHYDSQYNPANDIPAYEWLKDRGADVFFTGLPTTPITLMPRVNRDEVVLMTAGADELYHNPPGYIFGLNAGFGEIGKTLLKWVADNDWDWQTKGPAKIGMVAWNSSSFHAMRDGAKAYIEDHPEQFEWQGDYLTDRSFNWGPEVAASKDWDYLLPPGAAVATLIKQYSDAGGKAKFLMEQTQAPFLGVLTDARLWDAIDGSFFALPAPYWHEEDAAVVTLARNLLTEYHGEGELPNQILSGNTYLGIVHQVYGLIEIIRQAVDSAGGENFSQEVLYDTLVSFAIDYGEAYEPWSFSETDRFSYDHLVMYRADAAQQTLVRVDPEWIPIIK